MTVNTRADRIRRLIKSSSMQRITAAELSMVLDVSSHVIHNELKRMADVYIIDWRKTKNNKGWQALYACVHVPDDAPRPDTEVAKKSRLRAMPRSAYSQPQTQWVT